MFNKQPQVKNDVFPMKLVSGPTQQEVDPKRVKRLQAYNQLANAKYSKNEEHNQNRSKAPVKFHKFRQDARKLHMQLAQQNHDFMKITQVITKSVLDNQRYSSAFLRKNQKSKDTLPDSNNKQYKQKPNLILNYEIQLNSALVENKINTKQLFQLYPYKKLSIQIQPNKFLNPDFQFFFFRTDKNKSAELQNNLIQIVDQGLASDLKNQIVSLTHYLDYFDYIQFCKFLYSKPKPPTDSLESKYPPELLELARNALSMEGNSDEQDEYNQNQIVIQAANSCHRIFQCDQSQLIKPFDSIYFPKLQDFQSYKKYRIIEYKNMKIEAEDMVINTDVRNIIFSQKIYLINIIEQMQLSVELLKANRQQYLVKNLHEMMIKKIFEYLHLVCGYTTSKILINYNIPGYHEKIYQFLRKSILYGKQYEREKLKQKKIIQKYRVLEIWYDLPEKINGYARQQIHNVLYRLIEATLQFEKNMKYAQQYDDLKDRKQTRKYLPDPEAKTAKKIKNQYQWNPLSNALIPTSDRQAGSKYMKTEGNYNSYNKSPLKAGKTSDLQKTESRHERSPIKRPYTGMIHSPMKIIGQAKVDSNLHKSSK